MAGLFSSNEQDMLGTIMQQRGQSNQALGSGYGKYGGIVQAGAGMADIGGDAMFGGATGASDPRMIEQQEVKAIFSKAATQTGNSTSPEFYMALSELLAAKFPEQSKKAAEQAQKVKQETEDRAIVEEERVAKQVANTKAAQGKADLVKDIVKRDPNITPAIAEVLVGDSKALLDFLNPKVKTTFKNVNGRVVMLNSDTGEVLKDIGAAADTSPKITNILDAGGMKTFSGDVEAFNKAVEPFLNTYYSAQTAKQSVNLALKSNNNTAWESARTQIARAAGEGKLSNADIERVGSTPEIVQRLKNAFTGWTTGIPDEKTMKDLYSYASLLEKVNEGRVNSVADRWRKLANENGDISQERLNMLIPKVGESNTVSWDSLPK